MKQKKIPMRTCVVTKEKWPKKDLIRIVKDNLGNVFVDVTGKVNGHGAYIKKDLEVLKLAKKTKVLDRYLDIMLSDDLYGELEKVINNK